MGNEPVTASGDQSSGKSEWVAFPQNDSLCIILFTVSGLEKADVVEYL